MDEVKLVSLQMTRGRMWASQRTYHYHIDLTGEEWEQLVQALRLNRRMLDRGPEHELLDRALTLVMEKARKDWLLSGGGLSMVNAERQLWGLPPLSEEET